MDGRRSAARTGEMREGEDGRGGRRTPSSPPFRSDATHGPSAVTNAASPARAPLLPRALPEADVRQRGFCVQSGDPDEIRHGKKGHERSGVPMSKTLTEEVSPRRQLLSARRSAPGGPPCGWADGQAQWRRLRPTVRCGR